MLRSKAETARRGAATGFIRSRDLVNDALSFVVTQGFKEASKRADSEEKKAIAHKHSSP